MADVWRRSWMFAAGLLVGAVVAAAAFFGLFDRDAASPADAPPQVSAPPPDAAARSTAPVEQAPAPVAAAPPAVQPVSCTFQPLLAQGDARDGKFRLQEGVAANQAAQPAAYLAVAREAIVQGRPRDAEVALIMACRVAGHFSGAASADVGDAQLRLAQHYAAVASTVPAGEPAQQTLVHRAQTLLSDSVRAYTAALGKSHAKTRLAAQALDAVARGELEEVAQAGSLATLGAARKSAEPEPAESEAAAAGRSNPSFDCAKARSVPEKMICSDAELAQLDRDLGRLHAQAKSVTGDPAGFDRRNDQAWSRREATCRDKACLLQWYAARKNQLLAEFGTSRGGGGSAQR